MLCELKQLPENKNDILAKEREEIKLQIKILQDKNNTIDYKLKNHDLFLDVMNNFSEKIDNKQKNTYYLF